MMLRFLIAAGFASTLFGAPPELVVPLRPTGGIREMAVGRGGEWFATLTWGSDAAIQIWTVPDAVHLRTFTAKTAGAIATDPTGTSIAVGRGYELDVLDASTGAVKPLNQRLPDQANALAWSPDGKYLVAGWRQILLRGSGVTIQSRWTCYPSMALAPSLGANTLNVDKLYENGTMKPPTGRWNPMK